MKTIKPKTEPWGLEDLDITQTGRDSDPDCWIITAGGGQQPGYKIRTGDLESAVHELVRQVTEDAIGDEARAWHDSMSATASNGLRWHKLTGISHGDEEIEVMAATCIDGIGVIARWVKEQGEWTCEAMDTEGGKWELVDPDDEANEIPAMPPAFWDDLHNAGHLASAENGLK